MGININNSTNSDHGFFNDISENKTNNHSKSEYDLNYGNAESSDTLGTLVDKLMTDLGKLLLTDLDPVFDRILTAIEKRMNRKLTFDEYIQVIGSMIDERIIKTQKEQGIRFISGKLQFTVNNENGLLNFKVDCYYQNALKQWIKQESKGHTKLSRFSDSAYDQLKEIYRNGELVLDIDAPETSI